MSRTIFRYVLRTYLGLFVAILGALLTIFLVIDFVDRAKAYTGPSWVSDVAVLYGYKAIVATQQLGPAALLLAAAATMSAIRGRGELTALESLGFGWKAHLFPVGLAALVLAGGLVVFDEFAVVKAGPQVDQITAQRFHRWGDWRFYFQPKQWFRRGDRIFYLRNGGPDQGFTEATILRFSKDFQLRERIDADRMVFLHDGVWRLEGVVDRSFVDESRSAVKKVASAEYDLGAPKEAFRIRKGRPEQMRLPALREQIAARAEVGLPTSQFILALHNRFAYPLAGVPAALLAVALALRPGRKMTLTMAIFEGLLIAAGLWGMMVVSKTLVLANRMTPGIAAWLPVVVLAIAAAAAWSNRERGKWRKPKPQPAR